MSATQDITKKEEAVLEEQRKILAEEKAVLSEEKGLLKALKRDRTLTLVAFAALAAAALAAGLLFRSYGARASFDKAQIVAQVIDLAPETSGALEEVYVHAGDTVPANAAVARVGTELVKAKVAGRILSVNQEIGKLYSRGQAVAAMIDPATLRVVVHVDEDKGLKDLRVGQTAVFTVDAFGSRTYAGTVDEISPTSRDSSAVFTISDKREVQQFDVKIRFDVSRYPELENGMSAKVSIFKD